ncbi:MAG: hypothetical protein MR874_02480 [Coriobacteriaceae bacterium]|uniref:hypothetical protein n=1 Tax=Tractidigestivibacter sp. TaxID=2847320 RepID=UPI002A810FB5|nr:hypothetical protein [Tractidigestivibacter sp.]MCI6274191.1 hypothetical protein [Coriobacteriaceae bacterium]MCI6843613.1 hypothetical protein [Coriobacteriaceae bacterium]MCI7438035.1 hypothetical protein [Coriobacteriaceae bacterium]MDD7585224.1 hypothetical protein [Coriobacteriaceae bacterium]MDY4534419.1 hypothetical protein [Tractidigestivibacter sp.]
MDARTFLLIAVLTVVLAAVIIVVGGFAIGHLAARSAERDGRHGREEGSAGRGRAPAPMADAGGAVATCPSCGRPVNPGTEKCPWCDARIDGQGARG